MTDQHARVAVACPGCSPGDATAHEVLSTGGGRATVRCTECGHVHKEQLPDETTVDRRVVVSQDGDSFRTTVGVDPDEVLETGDEFVLETDEMVAQVRITSLETGPEERVASAPATAVSTIWTRVVDNVVVDATVHPRDGAHDETRSVELRLPGDYSLTVGETESLASEEFTITGIAVRAGTGHDRSKYDHDGDTVEAKDVKRVYAYDESSTAWSAW